MKMKNFIQNTAAILGVVLLLIGTLFCCHAFLRMQDAAMLKTVYPREKTGGTLTTQAEDIPVIRAIYELNAFHDKANLFHETGAAPDMLTAVSPNAAQDAITQLAQAKVLPEDMAKTLEQTVQSSNYHNFRKTETDFSMLYGDNYQITRYQENRVTEAFFVTAEKKPPTFDAEAAVDAYLTYLGMDGLPDWERVETADIDGQTGAAKYSKSAQLYVMAAVDTRYESGYGVTLGAYYSSSPKQ
ncbi:MAG: hypothetical protein RR709_08155 [Ruthenibacterium sp.]